MEPERKINRKGIKKTTTTEKKKRTKKGRGKGEGEEGVQEDLLTSAKACGAIFHHSQPISALIDFVPPICLIDLSPN